MLCRDSHVIVQELRCEVGTIRPDQRVEFRMNRKAPEDEGVSQDLEDGTPQLRREIDFTSRAIAEPKPDNMTGDVARLENVVVLHHYSSGGIGFKGCPCRASCQS